MPSSENDAAGAARVGLAIDHSLELSYNATRDVPYLDNFCLKFGLQRYDSGLPKHKVWRHALVSLEFIRCIEKDVPSFTTSDATQASPLAQIHAEIRGFCAGQPLFVSRDFHCLDPLGKLIWELKTPDVRLFGWFIAKNVMVLHTVGDANVLHKRWSNYAIPIDSTDKFRDSLGNLFPQPLTGVKASDVVSNKIR